MDDPLNNGPDPRRQPSIGVRALKKLWGIPEQRTPREKAPDDVQHDIYRVPDRELNIPPRPTRRRRRHRSG